MSTQGNGVYYYNSSMASAPQLSGTAGAINNVIKKCLVEGFGSEAPPGSWEVTWESGYEMAIHSTELLSTNLYFRSNDTNGKYAIVRGYESIDGSGVGTAPFNSIDWYMIKSNVADGSSRRWKLIADGYCFYLFTYWQPTYPENSEGYFFGDIVSYRPTGDSFNCGLIAAIVSDTFYPGGNSTVITCFYRVNVSISLNYGHALARAHTQIGSGIAFGKYCNGVTVGYLGSSSLTPPSTMLNGSFLSEVVAVESNEVRGRMPGIYSPAHSLYPPDNTIYDDVAGIGSVLFVRLGQGAGTDFARVAINLTGPWR